MSWRARTTEGYRLEVHRRRGRWVADVVEPETGVRLRRLRAVMVRVTFSIETEKGKEPPTVEVTVCTNVPAGPRRWMRWVERRVVNAVVKLLYILFDLKKDLSLLGGELRVRAEAELRGLVPFALKTVAMFGELRGEWPRARLEEREVEVEGERRTVYVLRLGVASERRLDRAIWRLDRHLRGVGATAMGRPREEYFASQDVIKIGVEYGEPTARCPRWPYVRVHLHLKAYESEGGRRRRGKEERYVRREREWILTLYIRRRVVYDVLRRLGVRLEWGERGE
jgi:hypothetical protein